MTDIIFNTTYAQPASNVADLNFVDNVINFKVVSAIGIEPKTAFQKLPARNFKSTIAIDVLGKFENPTPHFKAESIDVISIVPAIGFHVVHDKGDGDTLFDKTQFLCHFIGDETGIEIRNKANNEKGIFYTGGVTNGIQDTRLSSYKPNDDAFEGFVHQEKGGEYTGFRFKDFGRNLSVRGNDWCFEARVKFPEGLNLDEVGGSYQLFSNWQIKVLVGLNSEDKRLSSITLETGKGNNLFLLNKNFYFYWNLYEKEIDIVDSFAAIKLLCVDGNFELWINGVVMAAPKVPVAQIFISGTFNLPTYHLLDVPVVNYPKDNLFSETTKAVPVTPEVLAGIESMSNLMEIKSNKTHKFYRSKTRMLTIDNDSFRLNGHNYAVDLKYVYGLKKIVVAPNYMDIFFNTNVIAETSIRVDFPKPLYVWFYLDVDVKAGETNTFTPVNYQGNYLNNINSKILDKTKVFGYNKLPVEARGSFLRLEMIDSVLNVTLHFYENTNFVTKSVRLESATEFPLANFCFDAPPFETINDTTSFVIDVDSLYLFGTPYSDAKLSTIELSYSVWGYYEGKRVDGTDNFLEHTIISDVTDNLTGTTERYDYLRPLGEFTNRITNQAQRDELKAIFDNRDNFEYIGESNLVTYTSRTDIGKNPHYCYGVDRFIVNEDYVEIIFDDTFIEDSHKFYTPFKLKNYYRDLVGTQNNYEVYFEIRNNKFTCVLYEVFYVTNSSSVATYSYDKVKTLRLNQEFTATYKQKDLTIYDGSVHFGLYGELEYRNENAIDISAKLLLDEARFTIGDARYRDSEIVPTEPFPDYLQNVIEIQPNFGLSAIYEFGSNNTIAFDAKAAFRGYTKKSKVTTPTDPNVIVPVEYRAESIIGLTPVFEISREVFLNDINEISIVGNSMFATARNVEFNLELSVVSNSSFLLSTPILACDPLFESVVLLMPCDSYPLVDIIGHTVTSGSSVTVGDTKAVFNEKSLNIVSDINSLVEVSSSDFGLTKDSIFCIEFWFYPTSDTNYISIMQFGSKYVDSYGAATQYNWQFITSAGNVAFGIGNTKTPTTFGSRATSTNKFNLNKWNHVKATNEKCFLNGVEFGVDYISKISATFFNFLPTDVLTIGNKRWWNSSYPTLKLSDIRITIGSNRSTEKTPPETPYFRVSCIKHEITPVNFFSNSVIDFSISADMKSYPPIAFSHESEINVGAELVFRQIKTEIVYLPVENKSKVSTGFVDMLLGGFGVSETLSGGSIEFYTGSRPHSANHAVTGKLLGVITGIQFGIPANRVISKSTTELWNFTGLATGKIGWFRIKSDSSFTDYGQDSVREVRIDGEAGVDAISSNFDVVIGNQYFIDKFYIAWSN